MDKGNLLVGKIIKNLREDSDYTQQYLSEQLNVSKRTYQKYESGEIELGVSKLNDLAKLYKCTTDYILGRTEHKHEGIFEFSKNSDQYKVIYDNREFKELAEKQILDKIKKFIDEQKE